LIRRSADFWPTARQPAGAPKAAAPLRPVSVSRGIRGIAARPHSKAPSPRQNA
jgi:hypothetical protein